MATPLRVLILEDRPADAELIAVTLLAAGMNIVWQRVDCRQDFLNALQEPLPDIILADFLLPSFDAFAALELLAESDLEIPLIVVTGILGDERAAECIRRGARDFLLKDRLSRLPNAVAQVITTEKQRREILRGHEKAAHLAAIVQLSSDAIISKDLNGIITSWNAGAEAIFGYSATEMIGTSITRLIPDERHAEESMILSCIREGKNFEHYETVRVAKDGRRLDVSVSISPLRNQQQQIVGASKIARDVSQRKQMERALFLEKERLRITLDSIGDAVITTDQAGNVTFLNPVAEEMTGWSNASAKGLSLQTVFQIVDGNSREPLRNPVETVLQLGRACNIAANTLLERRGGGELAIEDTAAPIRDAQGQIIGVVLVFHDVSQARKMAMEMSYQATHDALTGLVNRLEFERRLEAALHGEKGEGNEHTVLYLDLDQFKIINDTCGHIAGDTLLRQLPEVLHENLRHSDTLARLGGDEFGVLLKNCSADAAQRIAASLLKAICDFRFIWMDKIFPLGVSIGSVTFSDNAGTLVDILKMADAACYVAKDKGRNRIHVYCEDDSALLQREGEMGWINRIRAALTAQRFVLHVQKIVPLRETPNHAIHHEMLLRMLDEQGALIPPMAFIPAAERHGLMPLLDRWVIETTFAYHAKTYSAGSEPVLYSINLSGTTLCDEHFPAFLGEQFALHQIPASAVCFEIAETVAIANLTHAASLMRELKNLGCRIALDDFGSGISSFAYLKHLPVDYLKINGSFVKGMLDNPLDYAMVEAINRIGHVMGNHTIAEFVESEAIQAALCKLGVDFAQGYWIAEPCPACDLESIA